jgi:quercetin dioxygenase-like cupin family protein
LDGCVTDLVKIARLGAPDGARRFPRGRLELYSIGGIELGRAVYEPGWRWSKHVGPLTGTALCEVSHLGVVLSGNAVVQMADGSRHLLSPGTLFGIPPGHDSWVVGDDEYVSLHLAGAGQYALREQA